MNIVVFSYNFLPANDAEGFCTSRLASALARQGHCVHVVTMDWKPQVNESVAAALLDSRLRITRIPFNRSGCLMWSRLRFQTWDRGSVDLGRCIHEVRRVLSLYDRPVLLTRSLPILSNIVGWYCRRSAARWVAHFSDPLPLGGRPKTWMGRFVYASEKAWVRRFLEKCDFMSITCVQAERFFVEMYGDAWQHEKMRVATHIGDPWLSFGQTFDKPSNEKIVSHVGTLGIGRDIVNLSKALDILEERGVRLEFIEAGLIKDKDRKLFTTKVPMRVFPNASPELTAAIVENSDVSLVIDLKTHLPYVPFLPSKFAYQVFTDVPIVIVTLNDSAMYRYAQEFREAGLFWADWNEPNSIASAIQSAMASDRSQFDRASLRKTFSRETVCGDLLNGILFPSGKRNNAIVRG